MQFHTIKLFLQLIPTPLIKVASYMQVIIRQGFFWARRRHVVPHNFEHTDFAEDEGKVNYVGKSTLDLTGIETRSTTQK